MIPEQTRRQLASGTVIASRYRLQNVAGAGGMATVWRAHDQLLNRTVAIKVMSDSLATDPTAVARFAREARTHAGIAHPNLVQMYDYSVAGLQPYLVLEYVPGCTLAARLERRGLDPIELHRLAGDLLAAVACVHDHGVLHRDIKPANVLIDPDGRARLTDFGIARLERATRLTLPGDVVGTLHFLAPELLDGDPPSRQSDLFALGVLLRAAAGPSGPGGSGGSAGAGAPNARLRDLIDWLTEPGPGLRPPDAKAALSALHEEPPTAVLSLAPRVRRKRLRAALGPRLAAGLAALAIAVAGAGALVAVTSGGAHGSQAPTHTANRKPASLDARLDRLATEVRHAAHG